VILLIAGTGLVFALMRIVDDSRGSLEP